MSNNIINYYHSFSSLFKLGFKLYKNNFLGIILLTGVIHTHVRGKYRKSACLSRHLGVKIGVKMANVEIYSIISA